MSNEQQQLIDEAYENYVKWIESPKNQNNKNEIVKIPNSKEKFIKTLRGDDEIVRKMGKRYCDEFVNRWGLQIEERELSLEERNKWSWDNWGIICEMESVLDEQEVPTRLITITYKEQTIESYEM